MNKHISLLALVALTGSAFAGEKALFNGNDLSGWEGNTELWSVKHGVIRGETQPSPGNAKKSTLRHNTFLVWKDGTPGDFELHAKFRITSEWGNSGIQYRSKVETTGADGPIISGYQADFESGKTYSGILYEEKGRGILAQRGQQVVVKTDPQDPNKIVKEVTGSVGVSQEIQDSIHIEDWNDYVVIAKGNHLQHFINGKKTIDVTDEDSRGAKEGVIALQMHAGAPMVVEFKDITLTSDK
ncbi:MAG: protein of unknown function (DUF1080) [Verrucomicrobia bacterium]|nr:MAG: protein of unknown function (DUF1080) [Verrucomicrobiota bacterium]